MKLGVSLSEKRNKNENETHWIMKMNTSARQVHTELPERISGVSQNENQTHPKMEMNTSTRRVQSCKHWVQALR
jgi:hypothetical protein